MPLKLWFLCLFGVCSQPWAAPGTQTLPPHYRGWQFCVHLRSVLTEDTAASTSAKGLHQNPPQRAGERMQWVSAAPLEAPSPAPALTCSAHSATLPLRAQPSAPGTAPAWKPSSRSRAAWLPASLIYLEMTLLLQCVTSETKAPLYNIITILLQPLPRRDRSTAATTIVPH